ncbi:class I SAM-dependent methyltransferase [Gracilibacillus kekensis]|uniref:Putative rRNA methylase n=1 Tax=Gracilibacillus kekensis TaxID=1027249 RepID=A0A1M7MJZ2_9BACI|nr:class I SAM-dependent methyltransferase [Gracilibacillus kekensis]SHM91157.1 Putative rRNA methylase [Gracilibacillus kekensis]
MKSIIAFSHQLLKDIIQNGDVVIDATCGNGNDTTFLSRLVGKTGKVYAFDIQKQAIEKTQVLLEKSNIENVELIHDGHEKVPHYLQDQKVAGAIFNLGYLPHGDPSIITVPETTIHAISSMLALLKKRGRIVIVIYHGHTGGTTEKNEVLTYCARLNQDTYQVLQYQYINKTNKPPFVVAIEKK